MPESSKSSLITAQTAAAHAARVASLWQKPVLSDTEAAEAIGLPYSTWQLLKARKETPRMFALGRRVCIQTDTLRAWLDQRAAA
ncbi:MAG: hypothetical protein HYY78_10450 [Betaproteobacteria bacterium]|nr:hypothetical protein [Betaproteobacteria bacterium]